MRRRIATAALVIALGNVASRVLGLVREQVIAGLWGAHAATDAFTAASRVPLALYDLLIGGAISAALIPVFSDYANPSHSHKLGQLASAVLNLLAVLLLLALAPLLFFAPQLMRLFASGFSVQTQELAVGMVRILSVSLVFMGLSGVFTALLYTRQRFILPALGGSLYNLGLIAAALLLHRFLGVTSLVLGAVLGTLLQALAQLPGLGGLRYSFRIDLSDPGVRRILGLYLPAAGGLAVSAVAIAIDTHLASRTGEGNLAAMRFATTLVQLPLGLLATATSFAVLPTLSRLAAQAKEGPEPEPGGLDADWTQTAVPEVSNPEALLGSQPSLAGGPQTYEESPKPRDPLQASQAYKQTIALGLRMVYLTVLPATLGLVILRLPIIRLLFQRGAFDALATQRTALAFLAYAPGLPAAAVDQVLIFAFYALKRAIVPVLVGVAGVGVYLVVALSLMGPLGMPGLALANSVQWIAHGSLMALLLWREVDGLKGLGLERTLLHGALASAGLAGFLSLMVWAFAPPWAEADPWRLGGFLLLAGSGAVLFYGLVLAALGAEELRLLWRLARTRMGWTAEG